MNTMLSMRSRARRICSRCAASIGSGDPGEVVPAELEPVTGGAVVFSPVGGPEPPEAALLPGWADVHAAAVTTHASTAQVA